MISKGNETIKRVHFYGSILNVEYPSIFRRWWEVGIKKWERVKNVGSKEKGRRRKEVNRVVVSHDGAHK